MSPAAGAGQREKGDRFRRFSPRARGDAGHYGLTGIAGECAPSFHVGKLSVWASSVGSAQPRPKRRFPGRCFLRAGADGGDADGRREGRLEGGSKCPPRSWISRRGAPEVQPFTQSGSRIHLIGCDCCLTSTLKRRETVGYYDARGPHCLTARSVGVTTLLSSRRETQLTGQRIIVGIELMSASFSLFCSRAGAGPSTTWARAGEKPGRCCRGNGIWDETPVPTRPHAASQAQKFFDGPGVDDSN